MSTTIEEALAWLHKAIGETWTPRELLARILRAGHEKRTFNGRFGLPIKAAPPIDTKFGAYRLDGESGTLALPFVRQFGMPWQTVPLWPPQIEQLFHCGETTACVAGEPEDDYGEPGHYILIEPLNEPVRITLSMVRIPDDVLRVLATVTNATTRTGDEPQGTEAQADDSPVSNKSKTPDAFATALQKLLSEISHRAAQQGVSFSKSEMPGTKADLQELAEKLGDGFGRYTLRTFDDYLSGLVQFKKGARQSDFYRRLFPELF